MVRAPNVQFACLLRFLSAVGVSAITDQATWLGQVGNVCARKCVYPEPATTGGAWGAVEQMGDGYDSGYGPASILYSTQWITLDIDLSNVSYAFSQIYDLFHAQQVWVIVGYNEYGQPIWGYRPLYGHLENYNGVTDLTLVKNEIADCENDSKHDWATVFYYGHMNETQIGNWSFPDYSYGFREQAPASDPMSPDGPDVIWDRNLSSSTVDNHHFVFLWVCNSGNIAGNATVNIGMPYSWTKQSDLSPDGYNNPDIRAYCFISFQGGSPRLSEMMLSETTQNVSSFYRQWLLFFYYRALDPNSPRTVNEALDKASQDAGYQDTDYDGHFYDETGLCNGYPTYWPGGLGQDPGWIRNNHMRVYGNGDTYLPTGVN
jgi:hypothetical protein